MAPSPESPARVIGLFAPRIQLWAAIAAGAALLAAVVLRRAGLPQSAGVFEFIALGIGLIYGAAAALESLRALRFDIDVLMLIGAAVAAWIGHPAEGALLLFLFTLSGALEDLAMARTKREVEALHALMPREALVHRDGAWVAVNPDDLKIGERVRIRPGERAATDARIVAGTSFFDQSAITGESMPREVGRGDELFAGTINTDDPVEAEVIRPAGESSLSRVLRLVTEARAQRGAAQRIIDRISEPYAWGVAIASSLTLIAWKFALGRAWDDAFRTAITLLIVASPCALVISTPTVTLSAIARAAKAGVLFKGGSAIEALARVSAVCFDKTGTLTIGRPKVHDIHAVAWSDERSLLSVAAGLEQGSTHPIAAAIREAAAVRGVQPKAADHENHTVGRGIEGVIDGGPARLGSYTFTEPLIPICFRARVQQVLNGVQSRGHIAVVVAHQRAGAEGGGDAAVIVMADALRPGARRMVQDLHRLGISPIRMLTGDNSATARSVAESLGLDRWDAELLPEGKVDAVRELKRAGARVAVIGDGVNDAPAMAAADTGIAIGTIGTEAATETADAVLLSDDLSLVPWALHLARRCARTVRVNIVFSIGVIVVLAVLTLAGSINGRPLPIWAGVLGHEGSTLVVAANGLRLLLARGRPA